jgi:5-methylcytosine-specific restriction endonuclease McrA
MGYTKHQGQYFKDRYHNDPEFRKRIINHIHNSQMRYPFRTWANKVIQSHRQRGIPIEITRLELEVIATRNKICTYCGRTLKYGIQNGPVIWHFDSASADRIDNTKSLSIENLQILCVRCNTAKSKMTETEFLEYIKSLYIRLFGKP